MLTLQPNRSYPFVTVTRGSDNTSTTCQLPANSQAVQYVIGGFIVTFNAPTTTQRDITIDGGSANPEVRHAAVIAIGTTSVFICLFKKGLRLNTGGAPTGTLRPRIFTTGGLGVGVTADITTWGRVEPL